MLDFSKALIELKTYKAVSRKGWNGKNMYIVLASTTEINGVDNNLDDCGEGTNINVTLEDITIEGCEVSDFILIKTADNKIVPWVASHADLLSDDWFVYDDKYLN